MNQQVKLKNTNLCDAAKLRAGRYLCIEEPYANNKDVTDSKEPFRRSFGPARGGAKTIEEGVNCRQPS